MLSNTRLIGFIPTRDADAARRFYQDVLGLTFVADDGFALVFETSGNMLRVVRAGDFTPASFTILGWETTEIEAEVNALAASGVHFARYPFLEQNAAGIWNAPGGSKVAWFLDPDGNTLSLSQHAPHA